MTRPIDPEEQLQRTCWQWHLIEGERRYGIAARAVPNGGGRSKSEGGRLKAMGVVAGAGDWHCTLPQGRTGWIEFKAPEQRDWKGKIIRRAGVQSGDQIAFQAAEEARGALYAVVWSLDELIAAYQRWSALAAREAA